MVTVRAVLELLYFASGIGLFIVGVVALQQIQVAKKDLLVRSTRESIAFAIQQCDKFARDILPLEAQIYTEFKKNNFDSYKGTVGIFCKEEMLEDASNYFKAYSTKFHSTDSIDKLMNLTNTLESFSIPFVKGIADEEIAFASIGASFCYLITKYYPFFARMRSCHDILPSYTHVIELFTLWQARLTKLGIEINLKKVNDEYNKLARDYSNTDCKVVKPIGAGG